MPPPNLIIAGGQKGGTTWLHRSLAKSKFIFGSKRKELNHFNRVDFDQPEVWASYLQNFPKRRGVRYYMESTPHYFRTPKGSVDAARNIEAMLDDVRILVILRDPVERYESAYIHHMMQARWDYSPTITELSDDKAMLLLGKYGEILEHWLPRFPDMKVLFYDDLIADPVALIADVMAYLGLENDIDDGALLFRTNDKSRKNQRAGNWDVMPSLTPAARTQLRAYYRDDIMKLQTLTGRDLSAWM